jgi:hypothetical protein
MLNAVDIQKLAGSGQSWEGAAALLLYYSTNVFSDGLVSCTDRQAAKALPGWTADKVAACRERLAGLGLLEVLQSEDATGRPGVLRLPSCQPAPKMPPPEPVGSDPGDALSKFRTVDQIAGDPRNPVKKGTLRRWLHERKHNGLNVAVIKIGGVLYLDTVEFNGWLERHRQG